MKYDDTVDCVSTHAVLTLIGMFYRAALILAAQKRTCFNEKLVHAQDITILICVTGT